jgi:Protein of unknown function (DUF2490)
MLKKIIFILLLSNNVVYAQQKNEFWSKINIIQHINDHLALGIDAQYRRQADFYAKDKNIFHYPLSKSIRLWIYYKLKNDWTLIASPIAYFNNENLENISGTVNNSNDIRSMAGTSKTFLLGRFRNNNRVLYEADLLAINSCDVTLRHRYRLYNNILFSIKALSETHGLNYYFFNEIFYKTQNGFSSFDQDHLYNGFQWRWKDSDFNIGYQYTYQKDLSNYLHKNQFLFFLNLTLSRINKARST